MPTVAFNKYDMTREGAYVPIEYVSAMIKTLAKDLLCWGFHQVIFLI